MSFIEIASEDGPTFRAYLARPETTPAPGLVLLQEVYGVNRFMRAVADYWAHHGFTVVVPDLYWRLGEIELDPEVDGHRERALETRKGLDTHKAVADTLAAVHALRTMEECTGRVGTAGYCLGGLLAYLTATRGDADCNVSYYGVGVENHLDEADRINRPLLLHVGETDPYTPPEVVEQLRRRFAGSDLVQIHVYEDTGHAFAREGASSDVPEMRELANGRTLELLKTALG